MKTITTSRLTNIYLAKLERYNSFATILSVIILILSTLWMIFAIGGPARTAFFVSIVYTIIAILSTLWTFQTVYRARYGAVQMETRYQIAWLLVGLSLTIIMIESIYYTALAIMGRNVYPSYVVLIGFLCYPCLFSGLLIMPSRVRFRGRMFLDALIATLCIFGILWFFLIGPAYLHQMGRGMTLYNVIGLLIALTYPCADLCILLAIFLLIQRETEPIFRFSLSLLGLSALALTWTDSAVAYQFVFVRSYHVGIPYIGPFWLLSILLVGLAALHQYAAITRKTYYEQANPLRTSIQTKSSLLQQSMRPISLTLRPLQSVLIYLPLIFLLSLAVLGETLYDSRIVDILSVLTAFIGGLIAFRSFFASRENEVLIYEREQRHKETERLQYILTYLTETLEMERLRERIVMMATSELGFDVALLLSVEEHDLPFVSPPHFFVNAASTSIDITQWRLQGENMLARILMAGKRTEIVWSIGMDDIPPEISSWCAAQQISTMTFFPLTYQDKKLGSIGIARRDTFSLSLHDVSIITTYAEQISAVLEHAFVYQEAHEHEAFARAMANISTRLNSAVVEPAEISQLICREGAHALKADYVVLYIANEQGQLSPLAAHMEQDQESCPRLLDWPVFHLSEYESLVHQSREPILIEIIRRQPVMMNGTAALLPPELRLQTAEPSLPRDLWHRSHPLRMKLARQTIPTAIFAPLVAGGNMVGMLIIARSLPPGIHDKRAFDLSDVPQVEEFVKQAGVAFNNAQLYQHLQTAHQRLQELDKLKDQFMITASHELRTPLTAVQGYIELIAQYDGELPPDQRREFLQKAQRGCDELVLLLGNVMDASQLDLEGENQTPLSKRVLVQDIIESVTVLVEPQVQQERREVHVQIPSQLAVHADPVRLRQVLMNLSVNALKYSAPGTPLNFFAHTVVDNGLCVVISVADQGKGVPPSDQKHLFQRFFRLESDLNSPVRGSGLGLYISRRLIEAMKGKIWIESRGIPGEGSTFHIQLPAAH